MKIISAFKSKFFGPKKVTIDELHSKVGLSSFNHSIHPRNFEIKHPDKHVINYLNVQLVKMTDYIHDAKKYIDNQPTVALMMLKALKEILEDYNQVFEDHVAPSILFQIELSDRVDDIDEVKEDYLDLLRIRQVHVATACGIIDKMIKLPVGKKIPKHLKKHSLGQLAIELKSLLSTDESFHFMKYLRII